MNDTVQFEVRNVFGNQTIYPANEPAQLFADIAGKKTLSPADLTKIRQLGFYTEQVFQKLAV